MSPPTAFYWLEKPFVAGLARPSCQEDLLWLRTEGIELIISLTDDPLPRHWVNEAGLFLMHSPTPDMEAPSQEDLDRCISEYYRLVGDASVRTT